jgi:hypothetical protein
MVCLLFAVVIGIIYFGICLKDSLDKEVKEAEPYQEQERPYIDPKEFNKVMRHQKRERHKMYRGKTNLS